MLGRHLTGKTSTSPGTWAKSRSRVMKRLAIFGEERGQSLVEFALVIPILFLLLMGIMAFAIAFWHQLTLTNATNIAAQQAAVSRQQIAVDLCTPVNTALYNAGSGINNGGGSSPFTFSISVNSAPVASGIKVSSGAVSACNVLLTQGQPLQVSTTYGCNLNFFGFRMPSCTLSASTQEVVQ
jgi:Flp pilus assembly protein TadG